MSGGKAGTTGAAGLSAKVLWVAGGLWVVMALLYWGARPAAMTYTSDSSVYVEAARSLALGEGYVFGQHARQPKVAVFGPSQSLLLSTVWRWNPSFPENEREMGLLMAWIGALVPAIAFLFLVGEGLPFWVSLGLALMLGTTSAYFSCIINLMSDPAFLALLFIAGTSWRAPWPASVRWGLVGLSLGLAAVFRFAAVGIIAPVVLAALGCLRQRDWKPAVLVGLPTMAGVVGTFLTGSGSEYGGRLLPGGKFRWEFFTDRVPDLMHDLSGIQFWESFCPLFVRLPELGARIDPGLSAPIRGGIALVLVAILALVIVGAWARRSEGVTQVQVGILIAYCSQVVLAGTHLGDHARYYIAVLPIILVLAWGGAQRLSAGLERGTLGRVAIPVGLACGLAANLFVLSVTRRANHRPGEIAELREIAGWARSNTPKDAVIALHSWLPGPQFAAWADRMLVGDYLGNSQARFMHVRPAMQGFHRADFVLEGPVTVRSNMPPGLLREVAASSGGRYRLLKVDPERERAWRPTVGLPEPR